MPGETTCHAAPRCPACGSPSSCRMETGEAYKGPCWCEGIAVSGAAMRRVSDELPEPRCICRACMEEIARDPEITLELLRQRRGASA